MDDIALVVDVLTDSVALAGVPVSTEIPATRPSRMVLVALTGDVSDEFIRRPRIMLTVWGESDLDAHGLAVTAVHELSAAAQTHDLLSHVALESMSRDEWSANGAARYIAQLDLTINV